MKVLNTALSILLPSVFLYVLGSGFFLLSWLGDVAIGHQRTSEGYFLELRDQRDLWKPVSFATYFLYVSSRWVMFGMAISVASYALWRWLWHGDLGK